MKTIFPGATIGVLGGGQLGRMMALSAQQMGYRVIAFTPENNSPVSQVCAKTICAPFEDLDAVTLFAQEAQVVTIEFENIPRETYEAVEKVTRIAPNVNALYVSQNRLREKTYLVDHGFPVLPFMHIKSEAAISEAVEKIGLPAVLKTSGFGYDGKGQCIVESAEQAKQAYKTLKEADCIYEKFVKFDKEISVIAARGAYGEYKAFGPIENHAKDHILDLSSVPARVNWRVAGEALEMACGVAESLDIIGLLCVEFFIVDHDRLVINEIAPRPHNSGHYTLNACPTSQFEQHVRAITGLPLGKTEPHSAAAMANLLGDLWVGGEPEWSYTLEIPDIHLHLYGKHEARPGRKMGHLTACSRWAEEAQEMVLKARDRLNADRIG